MDILTRTLSLLFLRRQKEIQRFGKNIEEIQHEQLRGLVKAARDTEWGVAHDFRGIRSYDDFRRVIMVSRYLDRCAQYSIDAASRIMFLLTGQRWNSVDIAGFDEDELESLRVPSGEGVILRPEVDAASVAKIPLDEVTPALRALIENPIDEDDEDDEAEDEDFDA